MLNKILVVLSYAVLIVGLLTATVAALIYGASFFFEVTSDPSKLFSSGCDMIVTGMVLVMWNER